ncbi:50S ribosomal protein L13 [bacterium]|nr:50S ribosomal protein L13 [bacterium]
MVPAARCIVTVAQRTTFVKPADITGAQKPKWYVIDAKDQVVGRLATQIATVLMGKHKACYTPHVDCGDFVIVLNADKVKFVGSAMVHPRMENFTTKTANKKYYRHSEFPGGLKELSVEQLWDKHPTDVLLLAVRRMLPKNALARHMLDKLKLYTTDTHPHQAQVPQPFPEHLMPS